MPLRTSWDADEQPIIRAAAARPIAPTAPTARPTAVKVSAKATTKAKAPAPPTATRIPQRRAANAQSIEATARILRPTRASLARATTKRLTRDAREQVEARIVERKRRKLARVAKHNGRLTVPQSPKLLSQTRSKSASAAALLTMTSRELLEIDAIRKRVHATRTKVRKYHEATTRSVSSTAAIAAATTATTTVSGANATFAMALRSCGGLGVPAVRRAKLTQPIGFDFAIDKRLAQRKRVSSSTSSTSTSSSSASSSEVANKKRRYG